MEKLTALNESAERNKQAYEKLKPADSSLLESFECPSASRKLNPSNSTMSISIEVPEFTSLCPITGQPDFAKIIIRYRPTELCVESKSLKLYMFSFRNHRGFHEECVNRICNDLVTLLDPEWLTVEGQFTPRGGIPFWPTAHYTKF